jgi:hypothetical protein
MTNPVTKVDNWLIWEGGYSRPMTVKERIAWKLGRLKFVSR